jgi:phosphate transport system protein
MARLMDLGMSSLGKSLIEMGDMAQRSLQIALDCYFKDACSLKKVFELSEKLRSLEDEIGDIAVELIARYQPVAKDLRFIRASMEIAYFFWRFGRHSYDIIDTIEALHPVLDCDKTIVMEMSYIVSRIVELSLQCLRTKEENLVKTLYEMDATVDALYRKCLRGIISEDNRETWNIRSQCDIRNILILRFLERISDHACYLGDCVFYLVTGDSSTRQ